MEERGGEGKARTYKGARGGEGRGGETGRGRVPRLLRFSPGSRGARIVTDKCAILSFLKISTISKVLSDAWKVGNFTDAQNGDDLPPSRVLYNVHTWNVVRRLPCLSLGISASDDAYRVKFGSPRLDLRRRCQQLSMHSAYEGDRQHCVEVDAELQTSRPRNRTSNDICTTYNIKQFIDFHTRKQNNI